MTGIEESAQRDALAELQRRLYRPGATDADRERYVALRDELARADAAAAARPAAPAPVTPPVAERPAVPSPRRRLLVTGGLLVGVIAAASAVSLMQAGRDGAAPVARPTPAAPTSSALGTSRRLSGDTAWTAAPVPRPTTVEIAVDDARVLGQRFSGSGTTSVPLITGSAPLDGGRIAVVLAAADSPVSWHAEGGAGRAAHRVVVTSTPYFGLAAPVPDVQRYRGAPPARIVVQAPAGTAWTMTVAFTR